MKKLLKAFFCLLPLICFVNIFSQTETAKVKVVGVVDGDTITVRKKDKSQNEVRIIGIDAPEISQDFGTEARKKLSALILNKTIKVKFFKSENAGTILGKVIHDGRDIGLLMLQAGYAWCEKNEMPEMKAYCPAEQVAKQNLNGLWQDGQAQPPWEFAAKRMNQGAIIPQRWNQVIKFTGQVKDIIDGATISVVRDYNSLIAVCINRLETPEPEQLKGEIAKQHLKDLLWQKKVSVSISSFPEGDDCYSGDVYLNNVNINLQMIRDGVAWVNEEYYYPEGVIVYKEAEDAARQERRGIWEETNPVAPWIFRKSLNTTETVSNGSAGYGGGSSMKNYNKVPKTVRIKSYTRKDGTVVRAYTRSVPGTSTSSKKN